MMKAIVRIILIAMILIVFFAIAGGFEKPLEGLIGMVACAIAVALTIGGWRLAIWAFLE